MGSAMMKPRVWNMAEMGERLERARERVRERTKERVRDKGTRGRMVRKGMSEERKMRRVRMEKRFKWNR